MIFAIATFFVSFSALEANAQSCCSKSKKADKEACVAKKGETTSLEVYGSCGMCETRIEKTALATKGVKTADWDLKTQTLKVTTDSDVCLKTLNKNLAKAGHDTKTEKASDKVYEALPGCCKYRK